MRANQSLTVEMKEKEKLLLKTSYTEEVFIDRFKRNIKIFWTMNRYWQQKFPISDNTNPRVSNIQILYLMFLS